MPAIPTPLTSPFIGSGDNGIQTLHFQRGRRGRGMTLKVNYQSSSDVSTAVNSPLVDIVQAQFGWDDLNPSEGVYDFSIVENFIRTCDPHGKKAAFGVLTSPSWPAWVQAKPGQRSAPDGGPSSFVLPVFWDTPYLTAWSAFITALAAEYRDDKRVEYILLSGWSTTSFESNLWDTFTSLAANKTFLLAEGFTYTHSVQRPDLTSTDPYSVAVYAMQAFWYNAFLTAPAPPPLVMTYSFANTDARTDDFEDQAKVYGITYGFSFGQTGANDSVAEIRRQEMADYKANNPSRIKTLFTGITGLSMQTDEARLNMFKHCIGGADTGEPTASGLSYLTGQSSILASPDAVNYGRARFLK